jgi:hypothetical protein
LLGDLAARAAEPHERLPDVQQWAEIESALAGGRGFHRQRRRWGLAIPALAALGLALGIGARLTLGHQERDCFLATNGILSVPDGRAGTMMFDDGTRITLGQATRGNLRALGFRRGAELTIESGHADLSVVHRWIGRWGVKAGPFDIRVTGTRFAVAWTPGDGHLDVQVTQGEVEVSGCSQADRTPVHAGQRLEANRTAACALVDDIEATPSLPAKAVPARMASAETVGKSAPETSTGHRAERKRNSTGKTAPRTVSSVTSKDAADTQSEIAPLMPEAVFRDWRASAAADDDSPPGAGQTAIGENGNPAGDSTGFVRAMGGTGTKFSPRANKAPGHLVRDSGLLCTHGWISEISCVDREDHPRKCDWDTNWGVHMEWYPRTDRKAWGVHAASKIAVEFHGKSGLYQLVAHRRSDPDDRWYCVQDYRSGRAVTPSDFSSTCRPNTGSTLSDFADVDQFALQLKSQDAPVAFGICLSAITLY